MMRTLLILAALLSTACARSRDSNLQHNLIFPESTDSNQSVDWTPVISAIKSNGKVTFRRIGVEVFPKNGEIISDLISYNGSFYKVLSEEIELSHNSCLKFKDALASSLASPNGSVLLCDWDPGVLVTIYQTNEFNEFLAGYGAICLHCGEWDFVFRNPRDHFHEVLNVSKYNLNLEIIKDTFPDDQIIQQIQFRK